MKKNSLAHRQLLSKKLKHFWATLSPQRRAAMSKKNSKAKIAYWNSPKGLLKRACLAEGMVKGHKRYADETKGWK